MSFEGCFRSIIKNQHLSDVILHAAPPACWYVWMDFLLLPQKEFLCNRLEYISIPASLNPSILPSIRPLILQQMLALIHFFSPALYSRDLHLSPPSISVLTGSWVTHVCAHMQMGPQWYSFHVPPLPPKENTFSCLHNMEEAEKTRIQMVD